MIYVDLSTQKDMASDVLECGKNRVWIDPSRQDDVGEAITKVDIRRLIQKDAIKEKDTNEQSRGRARSKDKQKEKGRHKGHGTRGGSKQSEKREWMSKVRAQRKLLKKLREEDKLDQSTYRDLYRKTKGGRFNSKKQLKKYMKKEGILKEGENIE